MTKPQTKQTITLETIIEAFDKYSVDEARAKLSDRLGARLCLSGVIEKVIKRDGLKLLIKPNGLTFIIFADFTDEKERESVRAGKFRKGSQVAITGDFRTAGNCALTLDNCRL